MQEITLLSQNQTQHNQIQKEIQRITDRNSIICCNARRIASGICIDDPSWMYMKYNTNVTDEITCLSIAFESIRIVERLCALETAFNIKSKTYVMDDSRNKLMRRYIDYNRDDGTPKIKWDRIHGKKRKILKFEIKKICKSIRCQHNMYNKYCGQDVFLLYGIPTNDEQYKKYIVNKVRDHELEQAYDIYVTSDYILGGKTDVFKRI